MVPLRQLSHSCLAPFSQQVVSAKLQHRRSIRTITFVNQTKPFQLTPTQINKRFSAKNFCTSTDKAQVSITNTNPFKVNISKNSPATPDASNAIQATFNGSQTNHGFVLSSQTMPFCYDRTDFNDPKCTTRLKFIKDHEVLIFGSHMIGIRKSKIEGNKEIYHLVAYDRKEAQLIWAKALPLKEANKTEANTTYKLSKFNNFVVIQFEEDRNISLIDPVTGNEMNVLEFPKELTNPQDCLHIGPNDIAYQLVKKDDSSILIGGKIVQNKLETLFKHHAPNGTMMALATHCGFYQESLKTLTVVGPSGSYKSITDCLAVLAHKDTLYTIEKNPFNQQRCLLNIRKLRMNDDVLAKIEMTITLDVPHATFGQQCRNGKLILLTGNAYAICAIFINLNNLDIIYRENGFTKHCINTDTGEIWIWEGVTRNLWKLSASSETFMGKLDCDIKTKFVHVDERNQLYFTSEK